MAISDLNGYYKLTFSARAADPAVKMPNEFIPYTTSFFVAHNGRLQGLGVGGERWDGVISENNGAIDFSLFVSVEDAEPECFLLTAEGEPTRASMEYVGSLIAHTQGADIMLAGAVPHGVIIYDVAAQRKGKLDVG